MNKTSIILFATGLIAAALLGWMAESCTSHARASSPADSTVGAEAGTDTVYAVPSSASPVVNKSGDSLLAAMTTELVPMFKEFTFTDSVTGRKMSYTLFTPRRIDTKKSYPLVVFMGDATTVGNDVTRPLSQGYGALVWATMESQRENPCFVLVPQFSGVAVNDNCHLTAEADIVPELVRSVASSSSLIDSKRVYITGQGMGSQLAMHYMIDNPRMFAAALFVEGHWNVSEMQALKNRNIIYITAGTRGKSYASASALGSATTVADTMWSARMSIKDQERFASNLLARGRNANVITFENGTAIPEGMSGNEALYCYDRAYSLTPVRKWLFTHHL